MDILVIGENIEKQTLWKSLLEDTSSYKIHSRIDLEQEDIKDSAQFNILICLNSNLNTDENRIVDESLSKNIPVIYVIDNISKDDYVSLIDKGVSGVINSNMSLESIQESIQIVAGGGVYINPPHKNVTTKLRTHSIKQELDIKEWLVFSLTQKGLKINEIARLLKTDGEEVLAYIYKIKEKKNEIPLVPSSTADLTT